MAVRTLTNPSAKYVFRIPTDPTAKPTSTFGNSTWMEFEDEDTTVLRTLLVNDLYSRYYWASPSTAPRYNSLARIQAGNQDYLLGVPQPSPAGVSASGGVSDVVVTRAYTYTWVTTFGEEGPPATPNVVTGKQDDSWSITVTAPTTLQTTDRTLDKVRLYRTITSDAGVATYFLVDEFSIGTTSYSDVITDTAASGNNQLESTNWVGPPASLKGIVAMPNGIMAGWTGSDVYFCEPYRPHAWPSQYSLSVGDPIVGLGVAGQTLVVCTTGRPSAITGSHPSQMTQGMLKTLEPCLSRASIVQTTAGVAYASQNGLVMVSADGVQNTTDALLTKEFWLNEVDPYKLRAVRHGTAFLGFHAPRSGAGTGVYIDADPVDFNWMVDDVALKNVFSDSWTGEVMTIHDGKVWHFDPSDGTAIAPYTWRSKIFVLPKPANFGALKVNFTVPAGTAAQSVTRNTDLIQTLADDQYGIIRLYADGELVSTREIRMSGEVFHPPSGFKATEWQVEVTSRVTITSIEIATSVRELRNV